MEVINLEMPCFLVRENLYIYLVILILYEERNCISHKISTNKTSKQFRILPLYYYDVPNIFQKDYTKTEKTEKIKNSLYVKCYCAIEGMVA